jgi:hypothetical protein
VDDIGPKPLAVYGDMRGGVHCVNGDEGSGVVGAVGDSGNVVDGADGDGGKPDGDESGPGGDLLFQVVGVEGEGLGVDPDPAYLCSPLGCGYRPGVHVGAVVELGDDDLGILVPLEGEGAGDREGERGHVSPEGDLTGGGAQEVRRGAPGLG